MYCTLEGVKRKLTDELWDEVDINDKIEATDVDTVAWINAAVNRSVDFSELELDGTDSIIRLAADCYGACRLMSEQLEGHGIDQESLAKFRCEEARDHIIMYCNNNGIIPSFITPPDDVLSETTEVGSHFAYAIGSDAVCIQGGS